MVADESPGDFDDVSREIDENGEQCSQLDHGDGRRGLFRFESCIGTAVESNSARSKNEMCRGADRDELGKTLNDAQYDRLKDCH